MADLFTVTQAQSSSILEVIKIVVDDTFDSWKLNISGSDGQGYRTSIETLDENASLDDIKGEAMAYLTGSEYYHVPPTPIVVATSREFTDNVGDKLGW